MLSSDPDKVKDALSIQLDPEPGSSSSVLRQASIIFNGKKLNGKVSLLPHSNCTPELFLVITKLYGKPLHGRQQRLVDR